ncbi:MAG: MaoC/PaaZ C-terminal domain-containing protein [Dehalococcoidia bacterium]
MPRYYDEVELGDDLPPVDRVATDQAVQDFCTMWDDPRIGRLTGRFTDNEAAKAEGLPGAIVPGAMSMGYLAQFLSQWADGGSLKKLDVVFRQLVLHERPLRLVGVVTDKNQVGDENQVECDVYLESADGERLVSGKGTVVLPGRE